MEIDLLELNERGDEDFEGLSDTEKALHGLFELATVGEMEGFQHYFTTDRIVRVPQIIAFLDAAGSSNVRPIRELYDWIGREAGNWEPSAAEDLIFRDANTPLIDRWDREFTEGLGPMWEAVKAHLKKQHGIEIINDEDALD